MITDKDIQKIARLTAKELKKILDKDNNKTEVTTFLGTKKACEFLGISRSTLHRKLHEIPHVKKGARLFFPKNKLEEYLLS